MYDYRLGYDFPPLTVIKRRQLRNRDGYMTAHLTGNEVGIFFVTSYS